MRTKTIEIGGKIVDIERRQHIWRNNGAGPCLATEISLRRDRKFQKHLAIAEYIVLEFPGVTLKSAGEGQSEKFYLAVNLPKTAGMIEKESAYLHRAAMEYVYMVKNRIAPPS